MKLDMKEKELDVQDYAPSTLLCLFYQISYFSHFNRAKSHCTFFRVIKVNRISSPTQMRNMICLFIGLPSHTCQKHELMFIIHKVFLLTKLIIDVSWD